MLRGNRAMNPHSMTLSERYSGYIYTHTPTNKVIHYEVFVLKIWNQPKYPSTDKWIREMWCVCTNTILGERVQDE